MISDILQKSILILKVNLLYLKNNKKLFLDYNKGME